MNGVTQFRPFYLTAAAIILLVPAMAMLITNEVNWTVGDFVVAAALIGLLGLALETISRFVTSRRMQLALFAAALATLALIWAELAVGLLD